MNEANTRQLYHEFPRLYRAASRPTSESAMRWGFMCGDGWFSIVRELSQQIEEAARLAGVVPDSDEWPCVMQVKEKFGGLRFYLSGGCSFELGSSIRRLVDAAHEHSLSTCESCGCPATLSEHEHWLRVECARCRAIRLETQERLTSSRSAVTPKYKIVFLDYDGVLHPDHVYLIKGRPVLRMDGFNLFEFSDILIQALKPYPTVRVVLSTSWVHTFCFTKAKAWLPDELQARVIGACYHSSMNAIEWSQRTRYQQIMRYVSRAKLGRTDWIAIDNDPVGWADKHRANLVLTDDGGGLSYTSAQFDLAEKLELLVTNRL